MPFLLLPSPTLLQKKYLAFLLLLVQVLRKTILFCIIDSPSGFKSSQISAIPSSSMTGFSSDQIFNLSSTSCGGFSSIQLSSINSSSFSGFQPSCFLSLLSTSFSLIDENQLASVSVACCAGQHFMIFPFNSETKGNY